MEFSLAKALHRYFRLGGLLEDLVEEFHWVFLLQNSFVDDTVQT